MVDFNKNIQESRGVLQNYINQLESSAKSSQPTGFFSNVDPVMLGLAQGFLSPTKTGSFGESIGAGLAGAQAPLEAMRKRQMDAQEKILQTRLAIAKLDMEAPYWSRRGLGSEPNLHTALISADKLDAQADALKRTDPDKADWLRKQADQIRQEALGSTYTPPAEAAAPPEDTRTLWEKIAPEALGGKSAPASGSTTQAPDTKKKAKVISSEDTAPEETEPSTQKPPKAYPDARLGTNPKTGKQGWFVVRDGKYYEVQ